LFINAGIFKASSFIDTTEALFDNSLVLRNEKIIVDGGSTL